MAECVQRPARGAVPPRGGSGRRSQKELWRAEYVGGPQRWRYFKVDQTRQEPCHAEEAKQGSQGVQRSESDSRLETIKRLGYEPGVMRRVHAESLLSELIRPEWRAFGVAVPEHLQAAVLKAKLPPEVESKSVGRIEMRTLKDVRVLKFDQGDRLVVRRCQPGHALRKRRRPPPEVDSGYS